MYKGILQDYEQIFQQKFHSPEGVAWYIDVKSWKKKTAN